MANVRPTLTNPTAPATFVENGTPVRIAPGATIVDDDNMRGGRIVVYGLRAGDRITLFDTGAEFTIGRVGDELVLHFGPGNYRTLGSITGGVGTPLVIQLNDIVSNGDVQAALRQLQYSSVSDDPASQVALQIVVTDRYGETSGLAPGQSPGFVAAATENNPFAGMTFGAYAAPVAYDVGPNGDGLTDLVVGRGDTSGLSVVKNLGGGVFQLQQTGYYGSQETPYMVSTTADIDGDGNIDLISANRGGQYIITYNRVSYTEQSQYMALAYTDLDHIAPAFADLNNDGRLDLVTGDSSGRITVYRGGGGTSFTNGTITSPFPDYAIAGERYSAPTFYDVDADGDLDALITTSVGLHYLRNDGGVFTELTGPENPFDGFAIAGRSKITFLDVNDDGARDLVVGKADGTIDVFLSTAKYGLLIPVTVQPIDDNPVIDLNGAGAGRDVSVSFLEQSMTSIKPATAATFADPDWRGGTVGNPVKLTIDLIAFKPGDAFSFGGMESGFQLNYLGRPFATFARDPISGRFDITLVPGAPQAGLQELIRQFTFVNTTGVLEPGTRSIVFTVADEFGKTTSATATVNAVPFNSVPTVGAPALTTLNLSEKAATATQIFAAHVAVSDVENDFNGGDLSITGVASGDRVTLRTQGTGAGQLSLANGIVGYGGTAIGTLTGGNGTTFKIAFNDAATATAVSAVYDNLMYQNVGLDPSATHTLRVTLTDGAARTTGVVGPGNVVTGVDVKVNLTLVNDYYMLDLNAADGAANTGGSTALGELAGQQRLWQNASVTDPDAIGYPWLREIRISIANATTFDHFVLDENGGTDRIYFKMAPDQSTSTISLIAANRTLYTIGSVARGSGANGTDFVVTLLNGIPTDWIQQIIRAMRYENNSAAPPTAPRDISVKFTWEDGTTQTAKWAVSLTDNPPTLDLDTGAAGLSSAVSYTENLAPVAIAKAPLWSEGAAAITVKSITAEITANASADDRLALNPSYIVRGNVVVVNGVEVGTVSGGGTAPIVITFNGVGLDSALAKLALANITFANGSEDPTTSQRTVGFTTVLAGGKVSTATATATVDVVATIDRPAVLDLNSADGATATGATASYTELATAVRIAPNATVIDADLPIVTGRTLTVSITAGGTADDRLSIINAGTGAGQVGVSGGNLTYAGVAIGTFTGGGASPIVVTFIDGASKAAVAGVAAAIGFSNISSKPTTAVRTVTFAGEFSQGETSTATATVNVVDLPNVPTLDLSPADGTGATDVTQWYAGTIGVIALARSAGLLGLAVDPVGMSLTVRITENGTASDRLTIISADKATGLVNVTGSTVIYGGAAVGTVSGGADLTPLVVQFNAGTPLSTLLAVSQAVGFSTAIGASSAARGITFTPQVAEGGVSSKAVVIIAPPTGATPVIDLTPADGAVLTGAIGRVTAGAPALIAPTAQITSTNQPTLRDSNIIVTIENPQPGDGLTLLSSGVIRLEPVATQLYSYFNGYWSYAGSVRSIGSTSVTFENGGLSFYSGSEIINPLLQQIALTTTSNDGPARLITITVVPRGGGGGGVVAQSLMYAGVAPVLDLNGVGVAGTVAATTYVDRAAATVVAPDGVLSDTDTPDLRGTSLTVALTANATTADRLSIIHSGNGAGQIGVSGNSISYAGTVIGSFTGGVGAAPLVVTLVPEGASKAATDALLQAIGFANLSNQAALTSRTASFTLATTDGVVTGTATIAFLASSDAPTLLDLNVANGTATLGASATYALAGNPVAIAPQGGIVDADTPNVLTTALRFTLTANANVDDRLTIVATGAGATAVTVSGGSISYGGAVVGIYTGGTSTTALAITFDGAGAGRAAVDAVVRAIAFSSVSPTAPQSVRGYDAVATYAGGYTSAASGTVTVAPRLAAIADSATVFADKTVAIGVLANDLTVNGAAPTIAQVNGTSIAVGATVTLISGARVTRLADGTLRYDPNGAFATLISSQKALATGSLLPTQATDSFTYTVANGGGDATVTVTVNGADAPVSLPDVATVAENGTTTIAVLANDIDYDGPALSVARINGVTATVGQAITLASGARVTLGADGTIAYDTNGKFDWLVSSATAALTGAQNGQATDSFAYTAAGGVATTVSVSITGVDTIGDQLRGGPGDDTITATSAVYVDISQGGTDVVALGAGADQIFVGGGFDATDRIDGGGGSDQVGLRGSYVGSLGNVINTESLVVLSGTSTRFGGDGTARYSYNLTTTDATVAAGVEYIVQANELVAGENLRFDGSAEQDGSFRIYAGKGVDTLIGGMGGDGFLFGEGARFTGADQVNGGEGNDQLALRGNYAASIAFTSTTVVNVETIVLLSAFDAPSGAREASSYAYNLVLNDATVAPNATLTINAAQLRSTESVTVNGAAETSGKFMFIGGQGNDSFTGGAGASTFYGGAGADVLIGGSGAETFVYRAVTESAPTTRDTIDHLFAGDRIDLSAIDAIPGGIDTAFDWIGNAAFTPGIAGQLRGNYVSGFLWQIEADVDGDGAADFALNIYTDHTITAADFIL